MVQTTRRIDPVAIAEQIYDLSSDDQTWNDEVLRLLGPFLRGDIGNFAGRYEYANDKVSGALLACHSESGSDLGPSGIQPELGNFGEFNRSFQREPGLSSLSDAFGPSSPVTRLLQERIPGLVDMRALVVPVTSSFGYILTGWRSSRLRTTARTHRQARHLGYHLRAAAAIRATYHSLDFDDERVDAVFDPDGRCLDARNSASSRRVQEQFRAHIRRLDRARGRLRNRDPELAMEIWHGLLGGNWSLVDRFDSDGRHYIVARRNIGDFPDRRALTTTEQRVFRALSSGSSRAEIAHDLGTSQSAIATHIKNILTKTRLRRRCRLIQLAHSKKYVLHATGGAVDLGVLVAEHAAVHSDELTAAEREVANALLCGTDYRTIAADRGVAVKTIANQVTSLFKKLHIHSREELAALDG